MEMSLTLLTSTTIALGGQPYDPEKSKVCLQLKAIDEKQWKPFEKKPLVLVCFHGSGHITYNITYYCGFTNCTTLNLKFFMMSICQKDIKCQKVKHMDYGGHSHTKTSPVMG